MVNFNSSSAASSLCVYNYDNIPDTHATIAFCLLCRHGLVTVFGIGRRRRRRDHVEQHIVHQTPSDHGAPRCRSRVDIAADHAGSQQQFAVGRRSASPPLGLGPQRRFRRPRWADSIRLLHVFTVYRVVWWWFPVICESIKFFRGNLRNRHAALIRYIFCRPEFRRWNHHRFKSVVFYG